MDEKQPRALLSVTNKEGIVALGQALSARGFELVSTGGTAKTLADSGLPVTEVSALTGFPECLDGRVKTLHPRVFAGILAMRDNPAHQDTLAQFDIAPVDVVVVNLYPFRETVAKPDCTVAEAVEQIDIGGPSLIRAAAKNYKDVAVLTDPAQYSAFIEQWENGDVDEAYRLQLAAAAFNHTAIYDAAVAAYFNQQIEASSATFPERLTLSFTKKSAMRYGENPHQQAAYYVLSDDTNAPLHGIESARFLHGKELSYNNISDAQGAIALIREFAAPACAAIKHASPCGVGTGSTVFEAFMKAYECDPMSIFGGIICFNRPVDAETALKMKELFLEVIIAPAYEQESLRILTAKKNLRLLELPAIARQCAASQEINVESKNECNYEFKSAGGGLLMQQSDDSDIGGETRTVVTATAPTEAQMADLVFAMKVVRHVKSNAIVVAKEGRTLGIGGGQVSRIWAAEAAVGHAREAAALNGAVMASDAYFPFPDVVELCAKAGIRAIIQPGGSKNDGLSVEACNRHGIAMVFTGRRHFKH